MNINILTDNPKSWFIPYGEILRRKLDKQGHKVNYVFNKKDLIHSEITFLLSCTQIIESQFLKRSEKNVVIHASDLPQGKGFSPMQWQILEGKNEIVLSAIEATEAADEGPIYLKESLRFDGTELYQELREKLGSSIIQMACQLVNRIQSIVPEEQKGIESFYRRRTTADDELDPGKSIAEQFNHLRIADNGSHPLYFYFNSEKYYLRIEKE